MKSKKMTKSTFAIIIMGIVMVAMLAFGGTFAYFTAKTSAIKSDPITTGLISLKAGDKVTLEGNTGALLPKESITAKLSYTDASTRGTWIVIEATADINAIGAGASLKLADITFDAESGLTAKKYAKGDRTVFVIKNSKDDETNGDVVLKNSFTASVVAEYDATEENLDGKTAAELTNMGKTFTISFEASSVQFSGHADEMAALKTLFGAEHGFTAQA